MKFIKLVYLSPIFLYLITLGYLHADTGPVGQNITGKPGDFTENFPPSIFGQGPGLNTNFERPLTGYAIKAVQELELNDEGERTPSGLELQNKKTTQSLNPSKKNSKKTNTVNVKSVKTKTSEHLPENSRHAIAPSAGGLYESVPSHLLSARGVQEVALIAGDLGFFPKTVFVSRDVPVRIFVTGTSRNTLCIMLDDFQIRKQIRSFQIEELTFTPEVAGKFRFHCPINGMEGNIVVRELTSR